MHRTLGHTFAALASGLRLAAAAGLARAARRIARWWQVRVAIGAAFGHVLRDGARERSTATRFAMIAYAVTFVTHCQWTSMRLLP